MSRIAAPHTLATLGLWVATLGFGLVTLACGPAPTNRTAGVAAPHRMTEVARRPVTAPKTTAPTATASSSAFPAEDARTALRTAEEGLRSCNAGPRQSLEVALRFEPSGQVSTVEVAPASDPAAACVRARLREVAVTPFKGDPVVLRVAVQL